MSEIDVYYTVQRQREVITVEDMIGLEEQSLQSAVTFVAKFMTKDGVYMDILEALTLISKMTSGEFYKLSNKLMMTMMAYQAMVEEEDD